MKRLLTAFFVLFASSALAEDIDCPAVSLRSVDKITGRTSTIEIPIGESSNIGNLKITPQRCLKKPPEEMPENAAFLLVEESDKDSNLNVVFNGWMFASNPAISAMEHPIWDIWVLDCVAPEKKVWSDTDKVQPATRATEPVAIDNLEEI